MVMRRQARLMTWLLFYTKIVQTVTAQEEERRFQCYPLMQFLLGQQAWYMHCSMEKCRLGVRILHTCTLLMNDLLPNRINLHY